MMHDITDRETITNLKLQNQNKDKFIQEMSHELKTPIQGILGILTLLEKEVNTEQGNRLVSLCKNNAYLLTNLVGSMTDNQLYTMNLLTINPTYFNLNFLIKEIKKLFEFPLAERKLFFNIKSMIPEDTVVFNDR